MVLLYRAPERLEFYLALSQAKLESVSLETYTVKKTWIPNFNFARPVEARNHKATTHTETTDIL
jgi:hypothetical protein